MSFKNPQYYLKFKGQEYKETTLEAYVKAERDSGFVSRNGERHPATAHFVGKRVTGRILYKDEDINSYEE